MNIYVFVGCTVDLTVLKQHLKKPIGVIASAVTQFGLMPAIAFGIAKGLNLTAVPAMATLLTASVPGGSLSNILTYLARGDMSLRYNNNNYIKMSATLYSTLKCTDFALMLYRYTQSPPHAFNNWVISGNSVKIHLSTNT